MSRVHRYDAGEVVFSQGDDGACMFFVLSGLIELQASGGSGTQVHPKCLCVMAYIVMALATRWGARLS